MKPGESLIPAALGREPADAVFLDAEIYDPFTCGWERASFGVKDGIVIGIGEYRGREEHRLHGARVV
ncbi:MAG TPA: adenine deaminase, partial [Methanomicrobiales archaeon]|nr:adenine deaminase [Methanomicrobiales archaeon]